MVGAIVRALRGASVPASVVCVAGSQTTPAHTTSDGVRHVRADLSSRRGVRELLFGDEARDAETIVHGALLCEPWVEQGRLHELNVQSTRELLAAAEEHPTLRNFVYCSSGNVYRLARDEPRLIDENEPLDLGCELTAGQRSTVEADVTVSTRIANSSLRIAVLRFAEILAPQSGSQLHDYLSSRVCLRPLGYDPMINVLSTRDAARAAVLAVASTAAGVFNVPGLDTLPLSELIARAGRFAIPLPGPLLTPLYRARSLATSAHFRYALDRVRFHYGAILDGHKAEEVLGYVPAYAIELATLFAAVGPD